MRINWYILALLFLPCSLQAQFLQPVASAADQGFLPETAVGGYALPSRNKLYQRNHGIIVGLQRGQSTAIELGGEAHWRKISLRKPHILGATANMEYNFADHMIGYKAGMWMKRGRINFTYGANVAYYTDFNGRNIYGIGPSVGFRLLGLHLVNGYNFLTGDLATDKEEQVKINKLYMSIRYYFPVQNKFVWDNKAKEKRLKEKEKKKKRKAKEKRKKERAKAKNTPEEKKPLFGIKGLHLK